MDPGPTGGGKTYRKNNLQNIINIRRTKTIYIQAPEIQIQRTHYNRVPKYPEPA